ncbi:hypothetical protein [Haliangium sp.]|uniref:hypothetical protein n=1 Tax=Haliangium sp. TaxID=2663208 RepID=UPI003D1416F9
MRLFLWIAIIALAVVMLAAVVWTGIGWLRGRMQRAGERRVSERYAADVVRRSDPEANFFGFGTRGAAQVRGSGVLVLTPTELWFSRYAFRVDHAIPLERIDEVELVGSHLGKKILGRKLLLVRFHNQDGNQDSAAWMVDDPVAWQNDVLRWVALAQVTEYPPPGTTADAAPGTLPDAPYEQPTNPGHPAAVTPSDSEPDGP